MKSKVALVKCADYEPDLVLESVRKAIDLLGGIAAFIKPASVVLIKPNILMAKAPEYGIDTHPEVVRAAVRILKGIGCKIYIGDGPSAWARQADDVDWVYEQSGIKRVAQEEDVELVKFSQRRWRKKFPLTTWVDNCDYIVSLPKFKTHDLMTLTGAIKNLYGLVCGTYKTELHKKYTNPQDFANILADIYQEARPALNIVDGIIAMEGDGPGTSGLLRNAGLLLVSPDAVALDSILALIMGLKPDVILTTKEAAVRGLGTSDISSIEILGEKLEDCLGKPFILPSTSLVKKIPAPIISIAKKLIHFYPKIRYNNCILCGACIQACPPKAISMGQGRIRIDYSRCISCFCCQEACPNAALRVKKSLLAKLIGL